MAAISSALPAASCRLAVLPVPDKVTVLVPSIMQAFVPLVGTPAFQLPPTVQLPLPSVQVVPHAASAAAEKRNTASVAAIALMANRTDVPNQDPTGCCGVLGRAQPRRIV